MPDNIRILEDGPMDEGTSVTGGESFEQYSASMPDNAKTGFDILPPSDIGTGEPTGEGFGVMDGASSHGTETPERKSLKMSKKMKQAMKKIQEKVASFPILYFQGKAAVHSEWALEKDEQDIITDSLSFVFEVLDINFEIEALNITLHSIWWVLSYPILTIGMIYVQHKSAADAAHPPEEEIANK